MPCLSIIWSSIGSQPQRWKTVPATTRANLVPIVLFGQEGMLIVIIGTSIDTSKTFVLLITMALTTSSSLPVNGTCLVYKGFISSSLSYTLIRVFFWFSHLINLICLPSSLLAPYQPLYILTCQKDPLSTFKLFSQEENKTNTYWGSSVLQALC